MGGTLGVTSGATVGGTLGVTGNTSLSTLSTSGAATLNSVGVTNNATVGGTLGVTGNTSLSTLSTSGAATLNSVGVTNNASEPPELAPDGSLRLAGVFKTAPEQISFATIFKPVGGVWRIEALAVQAVTVPAPPQPAATPSSWTPRVVPAPMRKR